MQDFNVSLPAQIRPGIPGPGAGILESPGAEDNYQVTLSERSSLYISRVAGSDKVTPTLLDNAGQVLRAAESSPQHVRFNAVPAGTYTIRMRGQAESYSLDVATISDDVLVESYPLDGSVQILTSTSAGQDAKVTFQAEAGQRIQLQTTDANYSTGGMRWNIRRPDGSLVFSGLGSSWRNANDFVDTMTLNQTGTWKVVLDPQGTATGSVKVRAWTVP